MQTLGNRSKRPSSSSRRVARVCVPDPAGYAAHDENVDFAQSFLTATTPAADVTFRRRGGVVVVGDNADLRGRVAFLQNAVGAIQGPFNSFWRFAVSRRSHCGWNGNPRQRCALARKASGDRTRALPGAACGDLKPPVWLGSARAPFSPLWLPLPCSRKRRASALLAPTYRHNKFPTATAFGDSLASSRRTNSRLGQILHSSIIRWRWSSKFSN